MIFHNCDFEKKKFTCNLIVVDFFGSRFRVFHPSEVDKMSTRNFWELNGKK